MTANMCLPQNSVRIIYDVTDDFGENVEEQRITFEDNETPKVLKEFDKNLSYSSRRREHPYMCRSDCSNCSKLYLGKERVEVDEPEQIKCWKCSGTFTNIRHLIDHILQHEFKTVETEKNGDGLNALTTVSDLHVSDSDNCTNQEGELCNKYDSDVSDVSELNLISSSISESSVEIDCNYLNIKDNYVNIECNNEPNVSNDSIEKLSYSINKSSFSINKPSFSYSVRDISDNQCSDFRSRRKKTIYTEQEFEKQLDEQFMDLSCPVCRISIRTTKQLLVHCKSAHNLTKHLECYSCDELFNRETVLKRHQKEAHSCEEVRCKLCLNRMKTIHIKRHFPYCVMRLQQGKTYTEQEFEREFQGLLNELPDISKTISNEEESVPLRDQFMQLFCPVCRISIRTSKKLAWHCKSVHNLMQHLECYSCDKLFSRQPLLERHLEEAHSSEVLTCKLCLNSMKTIHIKRHFQHCVMRLVKTTTRQEFEKQFKESLNKLPDVSKTIRGSRLLLFCPYCRLCTQSHIKLINHCKYVHNSMKYLECYSCDKLFGKKLILEGHLEEAHRSDKMTCKICWNSVETIYIKKHFSSCVERFVKTSTKQGKTFSKSLISTNPLHDSAVINSNNDINHHQPSNTQIVECENSEDSLPRSLSPAIYDEQDDVNIMSLDEDLPPPVLEPIENPYNIPSSDF